ncbi:DUF484 family protein [Lacisediminimonas profundi]|uniref:DUF484 family protein n=1 Tax=Lacisediminimonas profundi TaxID=2603856 RepID=UPI00124B1E1A|nr:DUF484 family protein [Lacisediminimonas profundi]
MTVELDSAAVAGYLANHPQFFEEHAQLFAGLRLSSALGGRTVSLQDRQVEVLREKVKALELRQASLYRVGEENDALNERFQDWTCSLLTARNDVDLPHVLVDGLKTVFHVPHATLRLWNVAEPYSHTWYAEDVSPDTRIFASSLHVPFCGPNNDFEAVRLLDDAGPIESVALLPLRASADSEAFGLLVLGSPDRQRFTADMATDFLARIARTSAAALSPLLA